jgi:hypothetical protein
VQVHGLVVFMHDLHGCPLRITFMSVSPLSSTCLMSSMKSEESFSLGVVAIQHAARFFISTGNTPSRSRLELTKAASSTIATSKSTPRRFCLVGRRGLVGQGRIAERRKGWVVRL